MFGVVCLVCVCVEKGREEKEVATGVRFNVDSFCAALVAQPLTPSHPLQTLHEAVRDQR